jgi:glyoxylate reductase
MARVVVTSQLPGAALELLAARHETIVLSPDGRVARSELERALADAEGLLCLLTNPVDRGLIAKAPRLRVIGNCAVGYDNIDVAAATERGIVVSNTPNVLTEATADFAWALLMAAARRVVEADRFVRAGRFHGWELGLLLGRPVHATTLGIVGLGRIGSAVARRASGFSMRVLYAQPRRAAPELEQELGASFVPLEALLRDSDFVSLHVPLSSATRHLIDRAALARMKPTAVLVNTSRGPLVDEAALAEALAAGRLAGAGLDVFEREPEVPPELVSLENVVLAPHIASATDETRAAMARSVAEDIVRVLAGQRPRSAVNAG